MISNLSPDPNDLDLIALAAWKEARGDGPVGMRAVIHCIQNRSTKWRQNYHDVVLGKNQFSSMSVVADPQYRLHPADGDTDYQYAWTCADQVLRYALPDITGGATFYEVAGTHNPWFDAHIVHNAAYKETVRIGRQVFYAQV